MLGEPAAAGAAACAEAAPTGASEETLRRLAALVDALEPARLCVLGDVVHAPASLTPGLGASLAAWRERRGAMDCVAVLGNHDRRAGGWLAGCGFRIVEEGGDVEGFRTAGMWVSLVLLVGIAVLPFLPETKDQPLPEE